MTDESQYELRFLGQDMSPEKVSASDLGDLIESFESLLITNALKDNPNLKKEDLSISLVSIKKGSLALGVSLHQPIIQAPIIKKISKDITRNDFSEYSGKEIEYLKSIFGFTKKHRCTAQISEGSEVKTLLAEITSETQISPTSLITGETTIYGRIFAVGGIVPNVHIETPSGEKLICKVNLQLAKVLANRLYGWVGLIGKARWDSKFFQIQDFEIEEILDYEPGSTLKTIEELKKTYGKYFKDITDVEHFMDDLRSDENGG